MRNDCEFACDCVKRANVVLHVGLGKEIFARDTHKATSAKPLILPTMTDIDTPNKITRRDGVPQAF